MPVSEKPYYEVEGIRYPRVTSILSILRDPDVEDWYARLGDKAAKAKRHHAERVGTTLDELVKRQVAGQTVVAPKSASSEVKQGWKAWREYRDLSGEQFTVGYPKTSERWGYGGCADLLNATGVTDIKATTRLRPKHWIQVMSYVPLYFSEDQWDKVAVTLIRLDTFLGTAQWEIKPFDRTIWETFLKLKDVYGQWFMTPEEPHANK